MRESASTPERRTTNSEDQNVERRFALCILYDGMRRSYRSSTNRKHQSKGVHAN
jgi:hypothetical protein